MTKHLAKKLMNTLGFEIKRIKKDSPAAHDNKPVGDMCSLLHDLKLRGLNCSWIMDVGANRCDWSSMAKTVFNESKFCLVEPQTEMKKSLEKFCDKNPGSIYILAGAGAANETKTLTIWDDLSGSSLLPADTGSHNQRSIELKTIDSIIEQCNINVPELIKLDIQGFELEALKGAQSTFNITEVYILEVSLFPFFHNMPVFSDAVNFMLQRNYVVYDFPGFLRRPLDGALAQCDVCFVKKDGFLKNSNRWS